MFLAGLKEPIGGNVRARQPKTIKQAFDAAIEERNFQSRTGLNRANITGHTRFPKPVPLIPPQRQPYHRFPIEPNFSPHPPMHNNFAPRIPPRTFQPVKIEAPKSERSKFVNYMNRPQFSNFQRKTFSQRNKFTTNAPKKPYVNELRNTEQEHYRPYDVQYRDYQDNYDHPSNSYYQHHNFYDSFQNNVSNQTNNHLDRQNENELTQNNREQENSQADCLNFQMATSIYSPR